MMYREFHDAGYRFFGIKGVTNGKCNCGNPECLAQYKHPLFPGWQNTPHLSDERLDEIEEAGQFSTGYGVVVSDGLLVVDVDARNGGVPSYAKLVEAIPSVAGAGFIVNTGSGNGSKHLYFKIPEGVSLVQKHADYPGLDFKSTGFVVGPGSMHLSGNRYEAVVGSVMDIGPAPQELLALLAKPASYRTKLDGYHIDLRDQDIIDMLGFMSADCDHDTWIKTGMAIHHATGGNGFQVWNEWSANGEKYPGADALERRWHSFGKSANPVTIGTLVHYAKSAGWQQSVVFDAGDEFYFEEEDKTSDLPFSVEGVDLLRPPGFVGDLAAWIGSQSRRPRDRLAVAGALVAMGNISGLRYTDDRDGVTTNIFAFGVAGSRTGKESILQAVSEIQRRAGMGACNHGGIKSEQEILRNLIRNQAAFYVMDEVGIFLTKVRNAQQRGGASYLEGIIGTLMSAYSKANATLDVHGDIKYELIEGVKREIAQTQKAMDNGDTGLDAHLERLKKSISIIKDHGLLNPFISLFGVTTAETFNEAVNHETATNGFIGRSLIFNERESVPRLKSLRFKRTPMPDRIDMMIKSIANGGSYSVMGTDRIEFIGDRTEIPTDDKGHGFLDKAALWMEDQADSHKELTGLEALYMGGYELISKVSLILAVPGGVRTAEHVRWAFELIRRDIDAKARLVLSNDREKDDPALALKAKIANLIDGDGEKLSVIYNRLRSYKREDIDEALRIMVQGGIVDKQEIEHPRNKKKFDVYALNSKA